MINFKNKPNALSKSATLQQPIFALNYVHIEPLENRGMIAIMPRILLLTFFISVVCLLGYLAISTQKVKEMNIQSDSLIFVSLNEKHMVHGATASMSTQVQDLEQMQQLTPMEEESLAIEVPELEDHQRLEFTMHLYAEDATQRKAVMNGIAYQEGELISKNTKLEEITQSGVVLNHDGKLYQQSFYSGW